VGDSVTRGDTDGGRPWLALAPALLLFAVSVILFARLQNVWIDETTQLSGATLTPGPLIAWLTGDLKIPFGVPADRMPPVSYFIDMIGWRIWGDNELAFRLYHAAITAGGLVLLIVAAARRFGTRVALIAGLILALSPKLIEMAVEIRAYPIFFALSCAQAAMVVRGDVAGRTGRLALFLLLGLLSGYTHFFGVVASSAYVVAVFLDARDVRSAVRVVIGYALLLAAWTGLAPFIFGAASLSVASQAAETGAGSLASFFAQLLSNGAILVDPWVAVLYFAGVGLLVALGAAGLLLLAARKGVAARHDAAMSLAIVLAAGIVVTVLSAFAMKGFNSLSPRYNVWMMPPVALLIALAADGSLAPAGKLWRAVRLGALALFALGAVIGCGLFLKRAEWFIHGPSQSFDAMVREAGPSVAVVHVGSGWPWGYFPLYRLHRSDVPQWLLAPDGQSLTRILPDTKLADSPHAPLSALNGYRTVLAGRIDLLGYRELRTIDAAAPPVGDLMPALTLGGWQSTAPVYRPGNYAFTAQLYQRPPAPRSTDGKE
jgi:hypothetical protein